MKRTKNPVKKKPKAIYEYMWKHRMKIHELAYELRITPDFLSKHLAGRANFSEKTARAVEKVTNGEVTADQVLRENPIVT